MICWWGGVGGRGGVDRRPGRAGMEGSLCVRKGWRATFVADGRCSFVATFAAMYLLVPQLNRELRALLSGRMPLKFIMLSAVSEGVSGRPCTDLGVAIACAACVACIQVGPAGASRERPPRVSATLVGALAGLAVLGFYLASLAYGLFYQAGVVHAAEASLSQLFNLMLAFLLLKGCGIGRHSSVGGAISHQSSVISHEP